MTKVSFSARHFILARHSSEFDVVHGAECPPVELRVEIMFAGESCFHVIYQVTIYVDMLPIKMATINLIYKYECIIVVLTDFLK